MTKLLDAESPREVQLFPKFYCGTINDFSKTNKMAEENRLIKTKQTLDETKLLKKVTKFWLKVWQDWIGI